jgi:hypothetical protein
MPYFQVALIFAIEGLDVNEPPPILAPKSAMLVLFCNPALASTKDVEAETDSLGPGLDELLSGNIDSLFLGWPTSVLNSGWIGLLESSADFVCAIEGLAYLFVDMIRWFRLMWALDSLLVSRAAASENEDSKLTDLAAEAAVGIDNLEVEEDAVGFIRLSPSGGRPAGGASLGMEVFPTDDGEIGPSSLTVPSPNGFWAGRFRDALQSLTAGTRTGAGTVVGKCPSAIGARAFGGAIAGTTLIGGAAEVGATDFRLGSPSEDLGGTVVALIGETIPSSSSSCQLESPGELSELDPVWIVDIVFSSVILLSDFHRAVFAGSFDIKLPPEGFKADRFTKALLPGVPGALRRGVPWGLTPLTRATALMAGAEETWNGLFPLALGREEEEEGDGLPKAGGIEASLMGDEWFLLGDMRSSRLLNAGAMRSVRLPVKANDDALWGRGVGGGKTNASTSLKLTGGGRASMIGAKWPWAVDRTVSDRSTSLRSWWTNWAAVPPTEDIWSIIASRFSFWE